MASPIAHLDVEHSYTLVRPRGRLSDSLVCRVLGEDWRGRWVRVPAVSRLPEDVWSEVVRELSAVSAGEWTVYSEDYDARRT